MNRSILAAGAAVVLIGGFTAWSLYHTPEEVSTETPHLPAEPANGLVQAPAVGATAEEETIADDPAPAMSPAKRIRHGKAAEQDLANAEFNLPSSTNEKVDKLIRQTEKALGGDTDSLIRLGRLIDDCRRGMNNEEQLQQRLDRMAQLQSRNPGGPAMPRRGGGSVEFQSFEELEADMWARFDECQSSKEVLDESLYEQVRRLAESGWPSARYLFAVWPPDQDSPLAVDVLELLEYQSLALEFTWQNMQEREPLGLLAMSQSYSSRRSPMFTPVNGLQGQAFLLASMKCGIDNKWLEERSLNFGQGFSRFQAQGTEIPSLDEEATALAEMFCPHVAED